MHAGVIVLSPTAVYLVPPSPLPVLLRYFWILVGDIYLILLPFIPGEFVILWGVGRAPNPWNKLGAAGINNY